MAIKGKKKTQTRGSQARRRPTPAPKPEPKAPRIPWYRKPAVVTPLIVASVIAIGAGAAVIANNRSESKKEEQRQEALRALTGEARALLQTVDPTVGAMIAVGGAEDPPETLADDAKTWEKDLEAALVELSQIVPAPGTETATQLLSQAIRLYQSGARTYAAAADLEGKPQKEVLERATEQVTQATSLWQVAISEIDGELLDAGLGVSQISVPGTAPAPLPTPTPSAQAEDEEKVETGDGGKGKKNSGDGKGEKKGDN
jgi:hypothetical protein